jgi:LacI family transcriptional regulator
VYRFRPPGAWYTYAQIPRRSSPTSHDVARLASVSQPTVSRALRDDPRLSEETRRRVRAAADQLHYVPSQLGRSLSTRVAGQVGIVVGDLRNPFYLEVLDKLHEALRSAEVRMLVLTPDTDDRVPLERLVDGSLDGAILTATDLHSPLPGELAGRSIPFVLLNREIDDAPGDVCVVDNEAGGALVARELPQDITLIGFDDVLLARWQAFQLTTVSQDIGQIVEVSTELLLERIAAGPDAPPPPRRVVLPARLVRRATHGPPVS